MFMLDLCLYLICSSQVFGYLEEFKKILKNFCTFFNLVQLLNKKTVQLVLKIIL